VLSFELETKTEMDQEIIVQELAAKLALSAFPVKRL